MRRLALPLAAAVALGVTACDHGSNHNQAAPSYYGSVVLPAPSPYTPGAVQRVFARAGVSLAHDRETERLWRSYEFASEPRATSAAFLTDVTRNVQVTVYPAEGTSEVHIRVAVVYDADSSDVVALQPVTATRGNVSVTYERHSPQAPRVLRALALLREARAAIAAAPPVPASVQRAISRKVPVDLRYVPTKVPLGYRYAKWDRTRSSLEIFFARNGRAPTLVFFAAAARTNGTCTAGGTHTYRFGSVRVFSENDRYDEQFWRCVRAGSTSIGAAIRRADGLTAAKRRAIAAMVASARQLG